MPKGEGLSRRETEDPGEPDVTPAAKQRQVAQLGREGRPDLRRLLIADVDARQRDLAEVEANALVLRTRSEHAGRLHAAEPAVHDAVAELQHREIRDTLRPMSPLERRGLYLARVRTHGVHDPVVRAIEGAPDIAPLHRRKDARRGP